ncbi:MAG: class C sortase [Clostridiaceae bacterium]
MMKKRLSYIIFLVGLTVFMYPHVYNILFEVQSIEAYQEYEEAVQEISESEEQGYLQQFREYNEKLGQGYFNEDFADPFLQNLPVEVTGIQQPGPAVTGPSGQTLPGNPSSGGTGGNQTPAKDPQWSDPYPILSTSSYLPNGAFGYLDIPKLGEKLPIYLGATFSHLERGVAQLEGTSLPVGGIGTNSVIAGHRSLARGALLFKHLDKLRPGDRFYIQIFNQTLTYEVIGSEVILPYQRDKLTIQPGRDLVTLLTCTPYGQVTHRLLVYGMRAE